MKTKITVAIVDDEKSEFETLDSIFKRYSFENEIDIQTVYFSSPIKFVESYNFSFDLIMLDIEMEELNGMDLAKKIREIDENVVLFFVTNMKQYAIQGYEVNAADFIVKPASYFGLKIKLDRIIKRLLNSIDKKIQIKAEDEIKLVDSSDIRFIETAYNHKLIYHLKDSVIETRGSIKTIENVFKSLGFLKCNNYSLINPKYVLGINGEMLNIAGLDENNVDMVSISRSKKKEFLNQLTKYLGLSA